MRMPKNLILTRTISSLCSYVLMLRQGDRGGQRRYPGGRPGDPPDPAARPPGCAFRPRCPAAFEPCDRIDPVLVTHNLAFAWALADRVAIMYLGKIVELGPVQTVLTEPLHPYTKSLLTVTPEVGRRRTHKVLTGEPPD